MRIAIIGSGISGLAAAHFLARAGHDVVCIDPEPRPGGLIRSERIDGFLCEAGPQALLDGPAETRALVAEAGLEPRLLRAAPAARRRFIQAHGRMHPLPTNPIALVRSSLLSGRGKLRALREPFIRAAPAGAGDGSSDSDESVLEFGARRFGAEAARWLLAPAMIGVYAGDAARLSVRSALPRLAELERAHGSVIRGALAMRRSGGGPGRAVSFPDGLQELPRALAEKLGPRRITARATAISRAGAAWRVSLQASAGGHPADGAGAIPDIQAQAVVLAASAGASAALLEPLAPAAAAALRAVRLAPAAVVCLGFNPGGPELGMDLRAYGFLVAREEPDSGRTGDGNSGGSGGSNGNGGDANRVTLLGCQYESSIFSHRAPAGGVLLRAIVGGTFDPEVLAETDDVIAARTVADLQRMAGLRRAPDLVRIWRHPAAIPQYEIGHAAHVAAADADLGRHPGLYLIGNALRGVGVNDCIAAGAALARSLSSG